MTDPETPIVLCDANYGFHACRLTEGHTEPHVCTVPGCTAWEDVA